MRQPIHFSPIVNLIVFILLALIWITFAPTMLGGRASYVVVNGNSMEPGFHRGDLVIVHRSSTYSVGDIVVYSNADINAFVIHRIIAIEQDRYVFKGDNNGWIDSYRPTRAELIGKLWIHIPKLGKVMTWLRLPVNMALTTGVLGGIFMAGILIKPNQRRKRSGNSSGYLGGGLDGWLYLFTFLTFVFLSFGIVAFIHPVTRPSQKVQYQQESQFSYSATGTPVIYDTAIVRSGEPVFPRLTCFLNIAFTYNVLGNNLQGVAGNYQLIARVMDEKSGWQRTIPMNERTSFNGNSFSTAANLDLCQIVSLVDTLKQQTGLRAGSFILEITPQIAMTANAAGTQIVDSFEPNLVFEFDEVHFSLSAPKGQADPLHASKQGSVDSPNVEPNRLTLLGTRPMVRTVRVISLIGFILSLGGLLALSSRILKTLQRDQEALIRLRYGGLLVNVYERDLKPASMLIDVTTIDELAKLAERHSTVILHMTLNFLHYYLVQCNGLTYRYIFSNGKPGIPEIESSRQQIINYVPETMDKNIVDVQPRANNLFGYVIHNTRTTDTEVTDTVILGKIRL